MKKPLARIRWRLAAVLTFALTLVGCGRSRAPQAAADLLPVAAIFQVSGWDEIGEMRTPRVVVYGDGTVLRRENEYYASGNSREVFWKAKLTREEVTGLVQRQTKLLRAPACSGQMNLGSPTEEPITVIYNGVASGGNVVPAYGLNIDDVESATRPRSLNRSPAALVEYYVFLVHLVHSTRDWAKWQPSTFAVGLSRNLHGTPPVPWPTDWPAWDTEKNPPRIGAEMVVPVKSVAEFDAKASPGVFALGADSWRAECYVRLPGADRWRPFVVWTDPDLESEGHSAQRHRFTSPTLPPPPAPSQITLEPVTPQSPPQEPWVSVKRPLSEHTP
ncbi:hypothetical protein [Opitutus sp. ER46]|uniref:hypothetical protein n=1 Tax=Opitutus sp. ER46 TaxID=2161864 RepID=UPI0011B283F2|nr:hypothetical protein [Opitutus sp. ER46]